MRVDWFYERDMGIDHFEERDLGNNHSRLKRTENRCPLTRIYEEIDLLSS